MIKPVFTFGTSQDARDIRTRVFVEEQGFEHEFDEYENSSWCLVLYLDNIPIATGRGAPGIPGRSGWGGGGGKGCIAAKAWGRMA